MSNCPRNPSKSPPRRRRPAIETKALFQPLFESVPDAVIVVDAGGRISLVNAQTESLFGYTRDELLGQPIEVLMPERFRDQHHHHRASYHPAPRPRLMGTGLKLFGRRKDGSEFPADIVLNPFEVDGVSAVIAIVRDITERQPAKATEGRRRGELIVRARLVGATLHTRDPEERLTVLLHEAMTFLGVEMGCLHVALGDQVALRCGSGLSDELRAHLVSFPAHTMPPWMREPRILREALGQPGEIPDFAKREGIQALANVPLRLPAGAAKEGQWLGALTLASRRIDALNEDEVFALQAMGEQLALAVDHARHCREAHQRRTWLAILREINLAIITHKPVRDILRVVSERVPSELGADAVAVSLMDEDWPRTRVFAGRLPNGTLVEEEIFTLADSLLHGFVERKEPVAIYDLTKDLRVQVRRSSATESSLMSYLGVPLVALDKTIGILHLLTTQPKMFAEEEVDFFRTLAGQMALAIKNSQMFEEATARMQALEPMVANMIHIADTAHQEVPSSLVEAFRKVTGVDHVGYYHFDEATQTLSLTKAVGCPHLPEPRKHKHAPLQVQLTDNGSPISKAAKTQQPVYLPDCHADPGWVRVNPAIRSVYTIPVSFGERRFGVIVLLGNELNAFSVFQRSLAETFAGYAAAALEAARLLQQTRAGEERYQRLTENAQDVIFRFHTGPDRGFDYVSPAVKAITGYTPEELYADPELGFKMGYAADRPVMEAMAQGDTQPGTPVTIRCWHKNGKLVWIELRNVPIYDDTNNLVAIEGIARNVTERKRAEEALLQQLTRVRLLNQITRAIAERHDLNSIFNATLRRLEDHLPIDDGGVYLYNPVADSLIVATRGPQSQPLSAALGLPEGTVIPMQQIALRPCVQGKVVYIPDTAQMNDPYMQQMAQVGLRSLVGAPLSVEHKVFGILAVARRNVDGFSDGECEFLRVLSEHVALAAHQAQMHEDLYRSFNELRERQQVVMQQERLRALGQMASGIVHDINNALSPVVGFTELLLMTEPTLSTSARQYLKVIQMAGMDITNIVGRMREFYRSRNDQEPLLPANLNELTQQVADLTRPRWKDMTQQRGILIEMATDLQNDLPDMLGIESEIREAMTNLIFNAVDAMPSGGTLTMRTYISDGGIRHSTLPNSPSVIWEITDTGTGMDEETRQRCLEPFFSTKGERGTGLGLAMVFGAMQRHEGDIQIESVLGQGTTVKLIFPVRQSAGAPTAVHLEEVRPLSPLRILYIDDEPLLRELLKEMLAADGHTVEVADSGPAGLAVFRAEREGGEVFDLVITDLGMPYVSGREVARVIKQESPGTPVILLTGWGTRLGGEAGIPSEADVVLSKPLRLNELRAALRRVLPQAAG